MDVNSVNVEEIVKKVLEGMKTPSNSTPVSTRNVDIPVNFEITENNITRIKKQITANDIRARIIGIPNEIYNKLSDDKNSFDISINNEIVKDAKINRDRKFFSKGLSSIYSKLGLITKDNVIKPCVSYWYMEEDNIYIEIESEQD